MSTQPKSLALQFQRWFKESTPRHFPINDIAECIQKRSDQTDLEHVEVLRTAMEAKTPIDPVSIFMVEGRAVLVDGNHRLAAARELGRKTINAHIYKGRTMKDAHLFARWKNNQNGKGLLTRDKAAGVRELLKDESYRHLFVEEYRVRPKALATLAGVSLKTARTHLAPTARRLDAKLNSTIKELRGEGWGDKRIAAEVGFSEQAVRDRRKKMESETPENATEQTGDGSEPIRRPPPENTTVHSGEELADAASVVAEIIQQTIQAAGIGLQNVVGQADLRRHFMACLESNPEAHARLITGHTFLGQLLHEAKQEMPEQAAQATAAFEKALSSHAYPRH